MKKDAHPKTHPVIFRDTGAKKDFIAQSTCVTTETEEIKGVKHYVVRLDVSSASHPFFTGKQNLVDTSGRVERFKKKVAEAKS